MAFTVRDYEDMVRLLEERPEWRAELRRLLLVDDLLALPAIVRDLTEAQQRGEARLERLETAVGSLVEAQQRTEARVEQLAEAQQRTEARVEQLAEAQQRTEARVEQLAEAQQRTEARLERLEAAVQSLVEAQQRTETRLAELTTDVQALTGEVRRLVDWQWGEDGRRKGERYELRILKRAPALFNGGEGGATHHAPVQRRLAEKMKPLLETPTFTDDEDPFLADLIWWKGDHFLVVEASLVVNGRDVARAARRAGTLQQAGVQATGVVIGEEWTGPEIRRRAEASAIAWKVGDDFSPGWLDFRRLAA